MATGRAAWVVAALGAVGIASSCGPGMPVGPDGAALQCTSNSWWTGTNLGSQFMNPGMACTACHTTNQDAPRFTIAGTVFPMLRDADRCNGLGGIAVEVTDARGIVVQLRTNAAGNFYSVQYVQYPITARVLREGRENRMISQVPHGDCNGCHTVMGTSGAPGRIFAP